VFVDEQGHPYRPETFSRMFSKLTTDAGLRRLRFHDGRHTAASLILAASESPKVVAEILGHSLPSSPR
jgi:integrase